MKKINVKYGADGRIINLTDDAAHYEQENKALQIDAEIETDKKVRAYIKAPNGNSDVLGVTDNEDGVYTLVLEDTFMSKGTLYVGFEAYDNTGGVERFEPLKVYVDSFVNTGGGNTDNVYVVTVDVVETVTLPAGEKAYVETDGNKKDVKLKFGIPQGVKGDAATIDVGNVVTLAPGGQAYVKNTGTKNNAVFEIGIPEGQKGEKGDMGAPFTYDNFTAEQLEKLTGPQGPQGIQGEKGDKGEKPVAGQDYWTDEEKTALINDAIENLPIDAELNVDSSNPVQNKAVAKKINGIEKRFNDTTNMDRAIKNSDFYFSFDNTIPNDQPIQIDGITVTASRFDEDGNFIGHNLRTAIFSDPKAREMIEGIETALENKVSKEDVDSELSETSENPVQNKVVAQKFNAHNYQITTNEQRIISIEDKFGIHSPDEVVQQGDFITVNQDMEKGTAEVESVWVSLYVDDEEHFGYFPHKATFKDTKAREMISNIPMQKIFEVTADGSVSAYSFDKDLQGNAFKLDEVYIYITLSSAIGEAKSWYCYANGVNNTANYLYFFQTAATGNTYVYKAERMCENLWFTQCFNGNKSLATAQPLYANNYLLSGVDYITKLNFVCSGIPAGSTITICGRKVVE